MNERRRWRLGSGALVAFAVLGPGAYLACGGDDSTTGEASDGGGDEGLVDASADHGIGEDGGDAAADAAPRDAPYDTGPAVPHYCQHRAAEADAGYVILFCEDFDDGGLPGPPMTFTQDGGSVSLDTVAPGGFSSPPALGVHVDPRAGDAGNAALASFDVSIPPDRSHLITYAFNWYVDAPDVDGGTYDLVRLFFPPGPGGCLIRRAGSELQLYAPSAMQTMPLPVPNRWVHVEIQFNPLGTDSVSVSFDGVSVATAIEGSGLGATLHIDHGINTREIAGSQASTHHIDDLLVTGF